MLRTRKYRTKQFRDQVDREWKEYFWKFIKDNSDKPWNWGCLSMNPNITFDIVLAHPDKPWNWIFLSVNPNITFDIVLSYPDKPWYWGFLSWNQNITFDNVSVDETMILGEIDMGLEPINEILDVGRIALSAEMLGSCEKAFEITIEYLKERKQFGVPIGSFRRSNTEQLKCSAKLN